MNPHGNTKHGAHGTLTYSRWKSMRQRCNDPKSVGYRHYGGAGIAVCADWNSFEAFRADMGECPGREFTVERVDNHVGYQPDNCRWATKAEQSRNRSICVPLTHNGVTKNATDWAHEIGISPNALLMRLRLGWTTERALTQPLKRRGIRQASEAA